MKDRFWNTNNSFLTLTPRDVVIGIFADDKKNYEKAKLEKTKYMEHAREIFAPAK